MILGNMLSANVIALNSFYGSLNRERQLYLYLLGNGASPSEALTPFMREALIQIVQPHDRINGSHGTYRPSGNYDRTNFRRQQPKRSHQISNHANDNHLRLFAHIGFAHLWISRKKTFDKYGMTKF